jgi:hypothetical protein
LPTEKQLPVTDFSVCLNNSGDELQLIHTPTAKCAYVFDLGFQGYGGRSPLFQLLDKFTQAAYLSVYPVVSAANIAAHTSLPLSAHALERSGEPKQIKVMPRIVCQNQLVLQRKGWYVPKEVIPQRQPLMSDWRYFYVLNEWRKAEGIAEEVYITISPKRNAAEVNPAQTKKLGRDDYKPQYINFNNPLLVNLFEKMLSKVSSVLKIEEMLPSSKQLLQIDQQRFVTECVLQWYDSKEKE